MSLRLRGAIVCVAVLLSGSAARALDGRPSLEEAIACAENADFEAALEAFDHAEASMDLKRSDLRRLFGHRAVVHFAMGHGAALELDLKRLVTLFPDATLPESAPPPLLRALEKARASSDSGPPVLGMESSRASGELTLRAYVERDPARLATSVRIFGRVGETGWKGGSGDVLVLSPDRGDVVWYAEAVGPGGVVVATRGSVRSPERLPIFPDDVALLESDEREGRESGSARRSRFLWIGTGVAAVTVAAVLTTVLLTTGSDGGDARIAGPSFGN